MKDKRPLPIRLKQENGEVSLELPMPDPPNQYETEFPSVREVLVYMVAKGLVLTRHHFTARSKIVQGINPAFGQADPLWDLGEKILSTSPEDVQRLHDARLNWQPNDDTEE